MKNNKEEIIEYITIPLNEYIELRKRVGDVVKYDKENKILDITCSPEMDNITFEVSYCDKENINDNKMQKLWKRNRSKKKFI